MVKVLFVCTGNICRSPTAEAVLRAMVNQENLQDVIDIDSAGTTDFHEGQASDPRARDAALSRGYDMSNIIARRMRADDYQQFDYLLAMDTSHLREMTDRGERLGADTSPQRLRLFLEFTPQVTPGTQSLDVPDPYYGGPQGFEHVLDLIEAASRGFLTHIRSHHL